MPNYKLTIEYDGTNYVGWQRQQRLPTIQLMLEEAVYKFCQQNIVVNAAGRTDAGVHALGQVANINLASEYPEFKIMHGINFYLKQQDIVVTAVEKVADNFHARFSAQQRQYLYKIIMREAPLALQKNRAWHVYQKLDITIVQEAANYLIGTHDFTTFRAAGCQANSAVKTIDAIRIRQDKELIEVYIKAKSFLYHQVRNIIGSLKKVGENKWPPIMIQKILLAKDRKLAAATAPACGLYFHSVIY